jgi:superfamily I DNA/RNA helicase
MPGRAGGRELARLFFDKKFHDVYIQLEEPLRRAVEAAISKFAEHTWAGLHLEKIQGARDERMHTIRITGGWRGVVAAPDSGDIYFLLTVLPHDKVDVFARRHRLSVNQAFGVVEVRDEEALEQLQPFLEARAAAEQTRLFGHVKDADMARLGIDRDILARVRLFTIASQLDELANVIPEPQLIPLQALARGMTVEDAWEEAVQYLPADIKPAAVDPDDLATAIERSYGGIIAVSGPKELQQILARPFTDWRRFLHPSQRSIAYRPSYAGPAQVTGGAGTGKTVTALHRAAFLAGRLAGPASSATSRPPMLLTTFTDNLAEALDRQLTLLVPDDKVRGRVEILLVDRAAERVIRSRGKMPRIADRDDRAKAALLTRWAEAGTAAGLALTARYLLDEWEQVILGQDIQTEHAYQACQRPGRGTPLSPEQRHQLWQATQRVTEELRSAGEATYFQIANQAARLLRQSGRTLYQHVIVDEGQDLHPSQWRLLRAVVPPGPDDMFIASDPHQRIYESNVSLARLGISVSCRSHRLALSYRTTAEILAWAVPLLGMNPVTGLDDEVDTLLGYHSPVHGSRPELRAAASRDEEIAALTDRVLFWLNAGIEPHAIGIAARSRSLAGLAREALKAQRLPTLAPAAPDTSNAIRVGAMHGMKGLEFQAVAVIAVEDGTVPMPAALTSAAEDALVREQDLARERSALFVACTRARDHLYVSYTGRPSPFLPGETSASI